MNFDITKFREVFKRSGLTKSEIARIAGTTRQTIYNWYTSGHGPTQHVLEQRAGNAVVVLHALMHAARPVLPFPTTISPQTRAQKIETIVAKVVSLKTN